MRRTHDMSRRRFLRGVLAGGAVVTVGLPGLDLFLSGNGDARADGGPIPPRFVLFFWGNGVHPERWVPSGEGTEWSLSSQLGALAGVKDVISVVSGCDVKVPNLYPHGSGEKGILSGAPVLKVGETETFALPTIDQVIAGHIGGETRFRSLEFGAEGHNLSHNGPNAPNPTENSPHALFERIFGAGFRAPGETGEVDPKIALRRSVLDAVMADAAALERRLGAADRVRLDAHLSAVRAIERRLARLEADPPQRLACARPAAPVGDYAPIEGRAQVIEKNRVMVDIVAMALACDQTRVASDFITQPVNNILFEGASAGHHQLTHDEPGDQPQVDAIVKTLVGEFGYLVDALRAIPEGDGTLLDNCAVLGTSEVSEGRKHSLDEFPILLAGRCGGRLRQGIHYRSASQENASRVHVTLMRALGIVTPGFGADEGFAADGIGALEV
ncbi:MAG: DUF1552 domain-containing protein [Myxococcales bacterium]|nr:DUF1552 domain-containing protein [Myxococcales bacterium]